MGTILLAASGVGWMAPAIAVLASGLFLGWMLYDELRAPPGPAAAVAHQAVTKTGEAGSAEKTATGIDAKTSGHASDALAVVSGNVESVKADDIKVPGTETPVTSPKPGGE